MQQKFDVTICNDTLLLLFTSFSWHMLRPLMPKSHKYSKQLVISIAFKLSYNIYIK